MSLRHAFSSLLHLAIVFALFSAGLFFVSLPYLPDLRMKLEFYLLQSFEVFTLIGLFFFLGAILFLLGFYGLSRGRYLKIKMGGNSAEVNASLVRSALEECIKSQFSKKFSLSDLEITRNARLEIGIRLSDVKEEESVELFRRAEKEFQSLLHQRFGYTQPFHLIVKSNHTNPNK